MNLKTLTEQVEQVSQVYTSKFAITRDSDWFVLKIQEELGELVQAYLKMKGAARINGKSEAELKEAFQAEVADLLCQTLLLAKNQKIGIIS